ncbi:MAG: bifunctional phosphopantothenoylcysteine decarboxylase/phosphopantothenate--cysteine ligase CoaBC [Vicinamibacterales bacterium]|jgi:phosphopantothenoylcysteine decarboxylase/phosphopantothenate--cysteine ligase|nr:bifunctional phosphopantothenoylcysteine decarboxylase/phosphopantothenate--cysteine ligase CoaBC [Vicinamibacterales bacterium]
MALIALGVTGGIGAYKAVEVARGLQKAGHDVVAVMTRNARRFVGPVTFEAITRRHVVTSQWTAGANADIGHIAIASDIALLLVAPATANILGKFAHGIADDFLSALYLATKAPVLVAPAMNSNMLEHPAVQANLAALGARGVRFVDPGAGYLACGWVGKGRLAEPHDIVEAADRLVRGNTSWAGRRVVVSAGPTCEDLDPVRFIGNRSSGRMGYALAAAAAARGASVTLVSGPSPLPDPAGVDVVRVRRAAEMAAAVLDRAAGSDLVVMAAAVADYRPVATAAQKVHKQDGRVTIELERTLDILAELGSRRASAGEAWPVLVGFSAETENVIGRARTKLASKQVDLVVANDVSRADAGFDVDTNAATLVTTDGDETLPLQSKTALADAILDRAAGLMAGRPARG